MKRAWVLVAMLILLPLMMGGCMRAMDLNPENAMPPEDHCGYIHFTADDGVIYQAQSFDYDQESENYLLYMVKITNDGVESSEVEMSLPKEDVVAIQYYTNNKWLTAGLVGGAAVFLVWLYYSINTSVFD